MPTQYYHEDGSPCPIDYDFVYEYGWRTPDEYPYSYDPFYIWGTKNGSTSNEFSDRLFQFDCEKYLRLYSYYICNNWYSATKEEVTNFIREYLGRPVIVTGFAQACNQSNGNPYWIFFIKENDNEK